MHVFRLILRYILVIGLLLGFGTASIEASDDIKVYIVMRSSEISAAEKVLNDPKVEGITFYIGWRKVQPTANEYDFSMIDSLLVLAKRYNKKLNLAVLPGQWSPNWLSGVERVDWVLEDKYIDNRTHMASSPLPWDNAYLAEFSRLITKLGMRYDNNDNIGYIAITGPSPSNGLETNIGLGEAIFNSINYTPKKFIDAWQRSTDTYASSFKNKRLAIALSNQIGPRRSSLEADSIADYAYKKLGKRFSPMLLALTHEKWFSEDNAYVRLATRWRGQTTIGFQMMKVYGNTPSAKSQLLTAVDRASGLGANYVEIWAQDYINYSTR